MAGGKGKAKGATKRAAAQAPMPKGQGMTNWRKPKAEIRKPRRAAEICRHFSLQLYCLCGVEQAFR